MNSRDELMRAIEEYFASMEIPQPLEAGHVVGFLDELTRAGSTLEGLQAAWADIELFVAFLEMSNTNRPIDAIEPWEYSRFVFEFIENDVYDPQSKKADRKKHLMATLVGFVGHLAKIGFIGSSKSIDSAFEKMFGGKRLRKIPRPPVGSGDLLGWLNGPNTGLQHSITAADLWLAITRDVDFDSEWKAMLSYMQRAFIPGADDKEKSVARLAWIAAQDGLDPIDFVGEKEPDKRLVERARKYFYRDDAVPAEPIPQVDRNVGEPDPDDDDDDSDVDDADGDDDRMPGPKPD